MVYLHREFNDMRVVNTVVEPHADGEKEYFLKHAQRMASPCRLFCYVGNS